MRGWKGTRVEGDQVEEQEEGCRGKIVHWKENKTGYRQWWKYVGE